MRHAALTVLACGALAGCGARSGLDPHEMSAPIDAATAIDAAMPIDAVSIDAAPIVCPSPSGIGFTVRSLGVALPGTRFDDISLGGDGTSVYLVAHGGESFGSLALYRLDGVSAEARELATWPTATRGRVSVHDGVARMLAFDDDLLLVEARGGDVTERGHSEVALATRFVPDRPGFDGRDVLLVGYAGSRAFVGPVQLGGESTSWLELDVGDALGTSQPETGVTESLVLGATGGYTLRTFDRDGLPREAAPIVVEPPVVYGRIAFGWLEDGTDQPVVVAGLTRMDEELRMFLQRFRSDGTSAGGFSAPMVGVSGTVDLTTVAVPPNASGYGVVAATSDGAALFHGAGRDFVGDARALPVTTCGTPSIAAGPCGYVIGCLDDGALELLLAVPPAR